MVKGWVQIVIGTDSGGLYQTYDIETDTLKEAKQILRMVKKYVKSI